MKKILLSFAALALMALQGTALAGDPAEMAEMCTDCHDFSDFEGMSTEEMSAAFEESKASSSKKAKAVADVSAEDVKAIIEFIAAEANK
jgi:cytochrome c553